MTFLTGKTKNNVFTIITTCSNNAMQSENKIRRCPSKHFGWNCVTCRRDGESDSGIVLNYDRNQIFQEPPKKKISHGFKSGEQTAHSIQLCVYFMKSKTITQYGRWENPTNPPVDIFRYRLVWTPRYFCRLQQYFECPKIHGYCLDIFVVIVWHRRRKHFAENSALKLTRKFPVYVIGDFRVFLMHTCKGICIRFTRNCYLYVKKKIIIAGNGHRWRRCSAVLDFLNCESRVVVLSEG